MILKRLGFFLSLLLLPFWGQATHLIGGEIFYECLGNDQYKITLKIYRDCFSSGAPFDSEAIVGFYDHTNNLVRIVNFPFPGSTMVPLELDNPCLSFPPQLCIEVAQYENVVELPPLEGGYTMVYQRCCRSPNIININDPGDFGSTYTVHLPGPEVVDCNSMPYFNETPPLAVCMGLPLNFDLSATDPDGDVLVYELCDPLHGGGRDTTAAGFNSFNGVRPDPPSPPVYSFVPWANGYSSTFQIDANPVLAIDQTGLMTGTPEKLGKFLFAVCVSEYRDGVLLSVNRRDLQVEVVPCSLDVVANFIEQGDAADKTACSGLTVQFENTSINGQDFLWDFGVQGITTDVSTLENPIYTFPDTGVYTVLLKVNEGDPCDDEKTADFRFHYKVEAEILPVEDQCFEWNIFDFIGQGEYRDEAVFFWDFGDKANKGGETVLTVDDVVFSEPGNYDVKFAIAEKHCSDTAVWPVTVYPNPKAEIVLSRSAGCPPLEISFFDSSLAWTELTYEWDLGNGDSSTLANPSTVYKETGYYDVSLKIVADDGCVAEDSIYLPFAVTVHAEPDAGFMVEPPEASIFWPYFSFIDTSSGSVSCAYDFGDGHQAFSCDTVHEYLKDAVYKVYQVVENQHGCKDTTFRLVTVLPEYVIYIPNAFTPNNDNKNETFRPIFLALEDYEFRIFDRWGELIFFTENEEEGWDGIPIGGNKIAPTGVYIYQVKGHDYANDRNIIETGHFSLLKG